MMKLIQKNYSLVETFTIFGSPTALKNSRIWTGENLIPSEQSQDYADIFSRQANRIKLQKAFPFVGDYLWTFEIFYSAENSDVSIEGIFDAMQENGIILNDNKIRRYYAQGKIDTVTPRTIISIWK